MRPRTIKEIAHGLVTETNRREAPYFLDMLHVLVAGVEVNKFSYGDRGERIREADALIRELKNTLARKLEEIGPELAAALAERSKPERTGT